MNSVLAAKVLMSHLNEITDGAYKTVTEILFSRCFQIRWMIGINRIVNYQHESIQDSQKNSMNIGSQVEMVEGILEGY